MILARVIILCLATALSSSSSECDVFGYNTVCGISVSNILAKIPDLEDEIPCQSECQDQPGCTHFSWMRNNDGTTKCFLLDSCDSTEDCAGDCQISVSGPVSPSLKESCCYEISNVVCNVENLIDMNSGVESDQECQTMCRDEKLCRYWTHSTNICFLYSFCDTPEPCGDCSSGPSFPPIDSCNKLPETHALVLGGHTIRDPWIRSIELIMPYSADTCEPDIPSLPVSTRGSKSVFYHGKIFYCGGDNSQYQAVPDCHTISVLEKDASRRWEQASFLVKPRDVFSMTVVNDAIYAVGGGDDSIESYKEGGEWKLEPDMKLPSAMTGHCSVSLNGKDLVVIGGYIAHESTTAEVLSFDVKNMAGGWTNLPSMNTGRKSHACDTANYEGEFGIFVTGGKDEANNILSSVEFYVARNKQWRELGSLRSARVYHSLSILTTDVWDEDVGPLSVGLPYVAGGREPTGISGGDTPTSSVERMFEEEWHAYGWLDGWRTHHASVNIPVGAVKCR